MGPRATVVSLGVVLVAAAAAALWWTSRSTDVADDRPRADVPVSTDTAPAGDKPSAVRASARRSGGGALVGSVRVYGTDQPVVGARIALSSHDGVVVDATTQADGSFAFSRLPKAEDWELAVTPPEGLGEAKLTGLVVVDRKTTDVGVVYLAPGFAMPGVVEDDHGAPIAGAHVFVVAPRKAERGFDVLSVLRELPRRPRPTATTTSDADGRFRLTGVPPGTYVVGARKSGFGTGVERSVLVAPAAATQPIRLVLPKGHVVEGRVVRGGGGSVAGVPVIAFMNDELRSILDASMPTKMFVTTDEKGEFAFDALAAGRWSVVAAPAGEAMRGFGDDVVVPRAAPVVIELGGVATLAGRVTGADDAPVAGAEVFCASSSGLANGQTDADGRYVLRGLVAAKLEAFIVTAEGYCAHGVDTMFGASRGSDAPDLHEGENVHDVKLLPGGKVRGLVVEQGTTNPIAGAVVSLSSLATFIGGAPVATTGEDGRFELLGVSLGTGFLTVKKQGWCPSESVDMKSVFEGFRPFGGAEKKDETDPGKGPRVVVAKQGDAVERTIGLTRAPVLTGRVLRPSGEPAAGARISAAATTGPGDTEDMPDVLTAMFGGGDGETHLTDADGRFAIASPAAKAHVVVTAKAPGALPAESAPIEVGGAAPPAEIELRLGAGGTIEGKIADSSGAPVEGANVTWSPDDGKSSFARGEGDRRAVTAADGTFRLAAVLTGKVTVDVHDGKHVAWRREGVEVKEGATARVDASLESGLSITGRVVRADGKPVAGAWVEVACEGATPTERDSSCDELTLERDGRFRVDALPAGKYRLVGHADDAADGAPVVVAAGVEGVELRLAAQLAIAGVVKFHDGRPAAGVSVTAVPRAAAPDEEDEIADSIDASTTAGADGSFRIVVTKPVEHDLVVDGRSRKPGVNVRPLRVKGVAAGAEGVAIEVEIGLTIAGRVTAPDGATPQAGVVSWRRATEEVIDPGEKPDEPQAVDAESSAPSRTPLRDGRFELTSLAPGKYVVTVEARLYSTQTVRVDAGDRSVLVRLTKGGTVKGRVLLPNGAPAKGSSVMVEDEGEEDDAAEWPDCETDADGRFVLEGVSAGVHRLVAYHSDDEEKPYQGEAKDVRVESGATVEGVEIRLKKAE